MVHTFVHKRHRSLALTAFADDIEMMLVPDKKLDRSSWQAPFPGWMATWRPYRSMISRHRLHK